MRSLFVGLVAATLAVFFSSQLVLAQAPAAVDPGLAKARAARAKQVESAAKGDKRAVEAEQKLKVQATTLAPILAKNANVPCTVTDARNDMANKDNVMLEVSCQEGIGYILVGKPDGADAKAQDCIPNARTALPTACVLPGNAKPARGLQPYMAKAGSDCIVANAQTLGQTDKIVAYEIACESGLGEFLTVGLPRGPSSTAVSGPCYKIAAVVNAVCNLTTAEANAAPMLALGKKANRCPIVRVRYVAATSTGTEYFEYACEDSSGFMINADAKGEIIRILSCAQAAGFSGGCTLTDSKAAVAGVLGSYTSMSKAAGFDCTVEKFANFGLPAQTAYTDVAELTCSNRPDGGIAFVTGDKAIVMNCIRAEAEGYRCKQTVDAKVYAALTDDLKSFNRGSCVVNGAKAVGKSSRKAFVEVTCADGAQGWIIGYLLGSAKPEDVTVCSQAGGLGGCSMPGNKKS